MVTKIVFAVIAAALTAFGIYLLTTDAQNLAGREKFARIRWSAFFPGLPVLLWCVPHAEVVAPDFLLPFLYPIAIIVPIASFFVLDYINARVISGCAIIAAYEIIHRSFDLALPLAPALAVFGWLLGFFGIWCSGIPHHFRDIFRLAARSKKLRITASIFFFAGAALLAWSLF